MLDSGYLMLDAGWKKQLIVHSSWLIAKNLQGVKKHPFNVLCFMFRILLSSRGAKRRGDLKRRDCHALRARNDTFL